MALAHLTLATQQVERTAAFLERTLGYRRLPIPANAPTDVVWLDLGAGQSLHVLYVETFTASPFEGEFGRHLALFHPAAGFPALKQRLNAHGADLFEPLRATTFERFFFREPINGYVFEIIDDEQAKIR
jgi:catechol 2,3-dioxygenase-like lactoylglutathione lyase family enzyme